MSCHARVVGPHALVGQPETNLGIIPGIGGTQRLPRLVGLEQAFFMIRTATPVNAKTACEIGWATGEPAADYQGAAKELIRKHLAGEVKLAPVDPAPLKLPAELPKTDIGRHSLVIDKIAVGAMRDGLVKPLEEGLKVEAAAFADCKRTIDYDVGMKNFIMFGPRVPAEFLHE
jgi:enoyl-CoA hydratase/carnithine racemase